MGQKSISVVVVEVFVGVGLAVVIGVSKHHSNKGRSRNRSSSSSNQSKCRNISTNLIVWHSGAFSNPSPLSPPLPLPPQKSGLLKRRRMMLRQRRREERRAGHVQACAIPRQDGFLLVGRRGAKSFSRPSNVTWRVLFPT